VLIPELRREEMRRWPAMSKGLRESGDPLMSGETANYHETRNPFKQTADYGTITLSTTSLSILPITTVLIGSSLQFPLGYWDLGKKVRVRMFCKVTTVLTPGQLHFRAALSDRHPDRRGRHDPRDVGGDRVHGVEDEPADRDRLLRRGARHDRHDDPAVREGQGHLGRRWRADHGTEQPDLHAGVAPAAVNVDTTLASTLHIDVKRSGSTVETITVHDFQVDSLT
jgi:hypothetical protein